MQADWSVEIGPDAPALEVPWSSPDSPLRYFDLKAQPELLLHVEEAMRNRHLASFLSAMNAAESQFRTAKCDVWTTRELDAEDELFGAALKFAGYIDLFFDNGRRFSFDANETFARRLAALLGRAPDLDSAAECVVRRCFFHEPNAADSKDGYAITLFVSGYADDEETARQRWAMALSLVQAAIMQLSR